MVVVAALPNPVFTAGLAAPRIYVSADLTGSLSQTELDCVIAHEAAHVRRRDPLRLTTYRFLSCVFFWMPALKGLAQDIADEAEIEADDVAARIDPLALASAILRLASVPRRDSLSLALAEFRHPDLLDRRIRRLAGENTPLPSRVGRRSIALASFALVLVLCSGLAAGQSSSRHPVVEANHCNHHHGSLWSHLRCSSSDCNGTSAHCDHGQRQDDGHAGIAAVMKPSTS
jgi:beta-lactamase regulating signal transducer with metallopeptidase domain